MTPERWQAFYDRARTDGQLIEHVIRDLYASELSPDAVALDGGANVGFHTLGLARHLVRGQVIAVEANRATLDVLKRNTQGLAHVSLVFAALQEDPDRQTIRFNCSSSHPGRSGVGRLWDRLAPGEVHYEDPDVVPATTIDRLVDAHSTGRLDFIKLDLEGGEFPALRGAQRSLRQLRPLVVTEHGHLAPAMNGFLVEDYFDWITSVGYTPLSPSGAVIDRARPYPFWYIFLAPSESVGHWSGRIARALDNHA